MTQILLLLLIQELALKLILSDGEANSFALHLQIKVLDKIMLFRHE